MKTAITVENISKLFHIGRLQQHHDTLRDALVDSFKRLNGKASGPSDEDTIWALKDVSFEVQQGEVLGIIGRNGAGKSTLLKVLARIIDPTSGRAVINGRVGSLLEVGTGFHPELTGRENIFLNGAILGMRRVEIERKFDEIVAFSEIEKFLDTPVKRYSSGMYVRLAFAVAAHLEPEILLVDEVLAVGDAQFQKKCLGKMGDVSHEGRTILFVSHNLIALRSLCPRAIWIDQGKLRLMDSSVKVIADYLQQQSTRVSEQIWDHPDEAPGDETVRIHRVWVESDNSLHEAGFAREANIFVGVEHWLLDPTAQIHVTLHFKVEQQVVAFTSGTAGHPSLSGSLSRAGLVRSICKIPARFLNNGQYNVTVLFVKDGRRAIHVLGDAISFEVIETAERQGAYFGKEPGVVRPDLPWEIQFLGDGSSPASEIGHL